VAFCIVGDYAVSFSVAEVWLIAGLGLFGYFIMRMGFEPAPLLMGFVLGPLLEEQFRRAMIISKGNAMIFLERPISAGLLIAALLLILVLTLPAIRGRRKVIFREAPEGI
jgi:TctA family transporter